MIGLMKFSKSVLTKMKGLAALIFLGWLFYFGYYHDKHIFIAFLAGAIFTFPIVFLKYAIPVLSKLTGSMETLPSDWSDDLLKSFANLMADPSADEINGLTSEIRRNNLDRVSAKAIFEGPLTMVCAFEWRAASFAMEDLYEFSPSYLRSVIMKNWRACRVIRYSPLWLIYKFMMPRIVRAGFYEALDNAFSPSTEIENLYR